MDRHGIKIRSNKKSARQRNRTRRTDDQCLVASSTPLLSPSFSPFSPLFEKDGNIGADQGRRHPFEAPRARLYAAALTRPVPSIFSPFSSLPPLSGRGECLKPYTIGRVEIRRLPYSVWPALRCDPCPVSLFLLSPFSSFFCHESWVESAQGLRRPRRQTGVPYTPPFFLFPPFLPSLYPFFFSRDQQCATDA